MILKTEDDIAKWFIDFEANRAIDEQKTPEQQDPRLVVYHERVSTPQMQRILYYIGIIS